MADLNETPRANRVHIAFFGLRNAGKSTLVNDFAGQSVAIVSDIPGTTTDPVSKAMEILPLGPCLITDTAGLDDDASMLGAERVRKSLDVLATTDIAVWVASPDAPNEEEWKEKFLAACKARQATVFVYARGEPVANLRARIAAARPVDDAPDLLAGMVSPGDRVICVCPIDESAPKGRLILPQVQVVRACLDRHVTALVCQPAELADLLARETAHAGHMLVVTDSQAFRDVRAIVDACPAPRLPLTSFSILFARQKGNLAVFLRGIKSIAALRDGANVLIAEGCTHHRQCNDIGKVKIPKALSKLTKGKRLNLRFASGGDYSLDPRPDLIVHCGGCMLTRREMLRRIEQASSASVPIVNYGILLAAASGILSRVFIPEMVE